MAYFKRIEPWTAERNIVCRPDMFSCSLHLQDDCIALRGVVARLATVLGVKAHALLAPFCVSLDKETTLAALVCML